MLSGFATGGLLLLAGGPLHALLARLGGLRGRMPVPAGTARVGVGREVLEAAAALAALWLLAGGAEGDVLVGGALAAAAASRRSPAAALALVLLSATAALRAGSTSVEHVAGTHAVLGPALLSPARRVAVAAGLGLLAAVAASASLLRGRPRDGALGALRSPRGLTDALLPLLAALSGVLVAAGPVGPAPAQRPVTWALGHGAALLGAAAVAALVRRAVPPRHRGALALAAAGLAGAAVFAGFLAR